MNNNITVLPEYPYNRSTNPWNDWWNPIKEPVPGADFRWEIEMAGTKKASISVKMKNGQLLVTWTTRFGQVQNQTTPVGDKYYDTSKLSVKYKDGLLTIHCPL